MKYKLLKEIDTDSLPIGTEFETDNDYVNMDSGIKIPCKLLIEQGFIEEVKETPKPRWKVGDNVVRHYNYLSPDYLCLYRVTLNSSNVWIYNEELTESMLRDPTPEELSTYFR